MPQMATVTNLPLQLTSFVGREREINEAKRLLGITRLLMLTGSGGCGKTRLAIRVAAELRDDFPDGVWLVDLAPLSDPSLVPQIVASVFDLRESSDTSITEILKSYLHTKNLLLVLDNCEHLIQACAQLCNELLHAAPDLKILATSREALNIAGETSFRVPSLTLPDLQQSPPLEMLSQFESVRLFVARASAARSDFRLTDTNARSIAQICARLDGMPLAIELAAARVKSLSVEQIDTRLDDTFQLLTAGSRNAPTRQQTLRATMDWSYALLTKDERTLLNRLSVFAGGWTLKAAEEICAGEGIESREVLDLFSKLVEKSLVVPEENQARYRMLETIRQYVQEKMVESAELNQARLRHLDFFLQLTEDSSRIADSAERYMWMEKLKRDLDNLRAAFMWSSTDETIRDKQVRLAVAMRWFWRNHGNFNEGRTWAERALELTRASQNTYAHAGALLTAGIAAFWGADYDLALARLERSEAILRELGSEALFIRAEALELQGLINTEREEYSTARVCLQAALAVAEEIQNKRHSARAKANLGLVKGREGDLNTAQILFDESLDIAKSFDDKELENIVLRRVVTLAYHQGNLKQMRTIVFQILENCRKKTDRWSAFLALQDMVWLETQRGLASNFVRAATLWGTRQVLAQSSGATLSPDMRPAFERALAEIRARLGDAKFEHAIAEGRAMSLEQAIEFALMEEPAKTFAQVVAPTYPAGLTEREVEVLRLLARGLSNQEIADQLVLSKRTVESHLHSVFNKLDVTTRTAAMRAAIENKII